MPASTNVIYSGPLQEDAPHVGRPCLRCGKQFAKHTLVNVHYLTPTATVTTHTNCAYNPEVGVLLELG